MPTETPDTPAAKAEFWGNIAQAVPGMFQAGLHLIPSVRENNLAIANANAQAALANAAAAASQPRMNQTTLIVAGLAIIIIIALLMRKN